MKQWNEKKLLLNYFVVRTSKKANLNIIEMFQLKLIIKTN